uniref:Uncharacterized protein n=1 Tax=Clandestinovirus TaxID=2831644 RepID=A0A8F8KTL5_9VIRU|nr:hypothetical protein KOM_12_542 [Clandestinovirus]
MTTTVVDAYEEDAWLIEHVEYRCSEALSKRHLCYTFRESDKVTRISNLEVIISESVLADIGALLYVHVWLQRFFINSLALERHLAEQYKQKTIKCDGEECRVPLFGTNWIECGKLILLPGTPTYLELGAIVDYTSDSVIRGFSFTRETFLGTETNQTSIWNGKDLFSIRPMDTFYRVFTSIESGMSVQTLAYRSTKFFVFVPDEQAEMNMDSITLDGIDATVLPLKTSKGRTWGYAFGLGEHQFEKSLFLGTIGLGEGSNTTSEMEPFFPISSMHSFDIVFNFMGSCKKAVIHTIRSELIDPVFHHMFVNKKEYHDSS